METLVVGLPLALSGEESEWTTGRPGVRGALSDRAGLPVHFVDERFTSVRAEKAVRSIGLPKHKREEKGRVDAASAVLSFAELAGSANPRGMVGER